MTAQNDYLNRTFNKLQTQKVYDFKDHHYLPEKIATQPTHGDDMGPDGDISVNRINKGKCRLLFSDKTKLNDFYVSDLFTECSYS